MFFPTLVLGSLNGILSPVVQATHSLMVGQTFNIERYMEQREALEREERERLPADSYYAEDPEMERELDALGLDEQTRSTLDKMDEERSSWSFKGWLMKGLAYILELAFSAAAVVIDALRTFYLVVLSILGPLAFAIAVFDGFQSSLTNWLSKYVSIYLWLPISDLFSAIIARLQILALQQETTSGTAVTLIFMVIGICGYMCIPSISTWIVQTGGISSFNHTVARTTTLAAGLMGMAAGKDTPAARRVARRQVGCRKTPGNTSITALHSLYGIQSLKNIESNFRLIRICCALFAGLCAAVAVASVGFSYAFAERQRQKIYVLDGGRSLMVALSQDLSQNRPVEAREHVRRFHELFFTLSPDKAAIESNLNRALLMADRSALSYYKALSERDSSTA